VAEAAVGYALAGRGFGDEIVMAFERVGREIGEPGEVTGRGVADRQRSAAFVLVERRLCTPPPTAIFGDAGAVVGPAVGIGRAVEVADLEFQLPSGGAGHAEMEPLVEEIGRASCRERVWRPVLGAP